MSNFNQEFIEKLKEAITSSDIIRANNLLLQGDNRVNYCHSSSTSLLFIAILYNKSILSLDTAVRLLLEGEVGPNECYELVCDLKKYIDHTTAYHAQHDLKLNPNFQYFIGRELETTKDVEGDNLEHSQNEIITTINTFLEQIDDYEYILIKSDSESLSQRMHNILDSINSEKTLDQTTINIYMDFLPIFKQDIDDAMQRGRDEIKRLATESAEHSTYNSDHRDSKVTIEEQQVSLTGESQDTKTDINYSAFNSGFTN
jgi:hypothetical protein